MNIENQQSSILYNGKILIIERIETVSICPHFLNPLNKLTPKQIIIMCLFVYIIINCICMHHFEVKSIWVHILITAWFFVLTYIVDIKRIDADAPIFNETQFKSSVVQTALCIPCTKIRTWLTSHVHLLHVLLKCTTFNCYAIMRFMLQFSYKFT